jgi:D-alanine-D-alanine ligase
MKIALAYNSKGSIPPGTQDALPELSEEELFAECDSPRTIAALADAIRSGGHAVTPIEASSGLLEVLTRERFDLVFNVAEGIRGEAREAQVPAILEFLGIPYTGSGPIALALAHDKSRSKEIWRSRGLAVPRGATVEVGGALPDPLPPASGYVVKPVAEGSSKGIPDRSMVRSRAEVAERVEEVHRRFRQAALVEEFLEGREFTVALLGNGPSLWRPSHRGPSLRALPIVEIDFSTLPAGSQRLYSYEAKWIWDRPEAPLAMFRCPAELEPDLERRIETLAIQAFEALGCRDWARVDLRLDSLGEPRLLEINPLPGILPDPEENSCFPKAARAAGLRYEDAILAVVDAASERLGLARKKAMAR